MSSLEPDAAAETTPDRGTGSAADFLPPSHELTVLAEAAQRCRGCGLYRRATQAVFGQGPRDASLMLVGEQPGDQEDLAGTPFVGPAGRLLDAALVAAGLDRRRTYVTNAVKHFRWKRGGPGGKRRLHNKPDAYETRACRPWLERELAEVGPRLVVLLGATAAGALMGPDFRVTRDRGRVLTPVVPGGPHVLATIHPSAVLRSDDREGAMGGLVADLRIAATWLAEQADQPID